MTENSMADIFCLLLGFYSYFHLVFFILSSKPFFHPLHPKSIFCSLFCVLSFYALFCSLSQLVIFFFQCSFWLFLSLLTLIFVLEPGFLLLSNLTFSFLSLVKNCNHKGLGIYYLLSAFIFGISGTLISVLIRIELYSTGNRIISPENQNFYNISITLHGFIMIFFLVMPGLFGGFGNYFVPIFQGSPEVVYPRVNNFSILILSLSYLFVIFSFISEFGGGTG